MALEHWTDANFSSSLEAADKPVVVDFWAEWCHPCKVMGPIFEKAADEMGDKFKFVKVDVDQNPDTANLYQVLSIPTMVIFENGQIKTQHSGVISQGELKKLLGA